MDYKEMLKKARDEMPISIKTTHRFEIPKVTGHIEGNKTIISNFHQIAQTLNRDIEHLLKYVLKELATPGDLEKNRLLIGRKIGSAVINEKIARYAEEFVLCKQCKGPDTQLIKKDKVLFVKCLACGAEHPVKSKI